jgi:hypothetical protein
MALESRQRGAMSARALGVTLWALLVATLVSPPLFSRALKHRAMRRDAALRLVEADCDAVDTVGEELRAEDVASGIGVLGQSEL